MLDLADRPVHEPAYFPSSSSTNATTSYCIHKTACFHGSLHQIIKMIPVVTYICFCRLTNQPSVVRHAKGHIFATSLKRY